MQRETWHSGGRCGPIALAIVNEAGEPIALVNHHANVRLAALQSGGAPTESWARAQWEQSIAELAVTWEAAQQRARLMVQAPELLRAVQLVLAMHDDPGSCFELDPMAARQLRDAVAPCPVLDAPFYACHACGTLAGTSIDGSGRYVCGTCLYTHIDKE